MVKVSFWTKLNLKQDLSYLRIQKKELKVRFSKLTYSMLKFPEQKKWFCIQRNVLLSIGANFIFASSIIYKQNNQFTGIKAALLGV